MGKIELKLSYLLNAGSSRNSTRLSAYSLNCLNANRLCYRHEQFSVTVV
jgi:hypothetical protein